MLDPRYQHKGRVSQNGTKLELFRYLDRFWFSLNENWPKDKGLRSLNPFWSTDEKWTSISMSLVSRSNMFRYLKYVSALQAKKVSLCSSWLGLHEGLAWQNKPKSSFFRIEIFIIRYHILSEISIANDSIEFTCRFRAK